MIEGKPHTKKASTFSVHIATECDNCANSQGNAPRGPATTALPSSGSTSCIWLLGDDCPDLSAALGSPALKRLHPQCLSAISAACCGFCLRATRSQIILTHKTQQDGSCLEELHSKAGEPTSNRLGGQTNPGSHTPATAFAFDLSFLGLVKRIDAQLTYP